MMAIHVQIETERGDVLASLEDPHNRMFWLLSLSRLDATFCLRFIDPYGNTIFNRLQIPLLQKELSTLSAWITESNLEQTKRAFIERAQAWPKQAFEDARKAVDMVSVADLRHYLEELLGLLSDAVNRGAHHYIRFVGD